jgi:hypothetical protein
VVGQSHPGLERRIESLVRRYGLSVQNRASRNDDERVYLGFMIAASSDERITEVRDAVSALGRVERTLVLGVLE